MPQNRSYFVDPALDENSGGFYCYCFGDGVQMDKRFFKDEGKAKDFGQDWIGTVSKA